MNPVDEFKEVVNKTFKDCDIATFLEWTEAHRADVRTIDHLINVWSATLKDPKSSKDASDSLWPLAALRKGLSPKHLKRIKGTSSHLLSAASPQVYDEREDDLLRAILYLILGDVYGEKGCLRRYLEGGKGFRSVRMAYLFALVGSLNDDLIRNRFLDEDGRLIQGAGELPGLIFGVDEVQGTLTGGPSTSRHGPTTEHRKKHNAHDNESVKSNDVDLIKISLLADNQDVTKQDDKKQPAGQRTHEQEYRPKIDLGQESLKGSPRLGPEGRDKLILGEFMPYAKEQPKQAIRLAYQMVRLAESELPPEFRPTLGHGQAADRISELKGINLHPTQLRRYFDEERLQIGVLGADGEPRFSPADCEAYVQPPPKKPGRKPKNSK